MNIKAFKFRMLTAIVFAFAAFSAAAADMPALPAGMNAVAKPVRLPAFNLATPGGGKVRADEFNGKVVVARFWATW
ncbi:MAG: hypothetical protein JWN94_1998 [Betaproteobacteria bacterium]|nr:hypothetical protein [Betaproteobacteria bacterium]